MPDKTLISLKEIIGQLRRSQNLSERELSQRAGLNPGSLNSFLRNENQDGKIGSLTGIARALGVTPAYLLATPEERALLEARTDPAKQPIADVAAEQLKELTRRVNEMEGRIQNGPTTPQSTPERPAPSPLVARLLPLLESLPESNVAALEGVVATMLARQQPKGRKRSGND